MKAKKLSIEEITTCEGREYNPQIWQSNIDRMLKNYSNVSFYLVPSGDGYAYNRYYVEYTLESGLNLFSDFGYSSTLSNGGFFRVDKIQQTKDGRDMAHIITLSEEGRGDEIADFIKDIEGSPYYEIYFGKFYSEDTKGMVMIGTNAEARRWMTERSVNYGLVFSKG
jgi:hypothetical protein